MPGDAPTPNRTITVGPDAFPAIDLGEGPPLLFLHGALGDCRTWARHAAILSPRLRCIAPTQRWFGTGAWRPDGPAFGTAAHADDLAALCGALALGPVSLVAWSYAGHVALLAALARPELFARILIFEPGVPTYVEDEAAMAAFGQDARAAFGPIMEAAQAGDLTLAVRRLIDASAAREGYYDTQSADRRTVLSENAHTLPLLFTQTRPPRLSAADLAAIAVPVTVAWGAETRPIYAIPSRAAAAAIGGDGHAEVPRVGHLWPDEDPRGFAAFVERWLSRS